MKKVIILFLLISFCGGSSVSTSIQTQQEEIRDDGSQESKQTDSNEQSSSSSNQESGNQSQSSGLTIQTLPDIKEFITNKSDSVFLLI